VLRNEDEPLAGGDPLHRRAGDRSGAPHPGTGGGTLHARVLTFHADANSMPQVVAALDASLRGYAREPGFKGLLCLERDGLRDQVMIITLWDAHGAQATAHKAEDVRELIAAAADMGVTSRAFEVLGFIPGPSTVDEVVLHETSPRVSHSDEGDVPGLRGARAGARFPVTTSGVAASGRVRCVA